MVLAFLFLILGLGCSQTQIVYNLSDWFLLKRIDKYFNLTSKQEEFLEKKIEGLQQWHRQNEIPKLVEVLENLQDRYRDGLNLEDVLWIQKTHWGFWERLFKKGLCDFSGFLSMVNDDQILHLESQFQINNQYLIDQTKLAPPELRAETLDWLFKFLEDWYGYLTPEQKANMEKLVTEDPEWIKIKLEKRQTFQKNFVRILKKHQSSSKICKELSPMIIDAKATWPANFRTRFEQKEQKWQQIFLQIDATMQPNQRKNVLQRIENYRLDFKELLG